MDEARSRRGEDANELARTRARTSAWLDIVLDPAYLVDPKSLRLLEANDPAAQQSGWRHDEVVGRSLLFLLPLVDPAVIRSPPSSREAPADSSPNVGTVLRTRDGRLIPVDVLVGQVKIDGRSPVVVEVHDARDRVESQARLHRLVDAERAHAAELEAMLAALGDAVIVCTPDGHVALANPATAEIFPGVTINSYADLCDQLDDPDDALPRLAAQHRQGPVELHVRGSEERWIELSAYPVPGSKEAQEAEPGAVDATILLARDVSAAREVRRTREAFIGVLSHELRTPVTTILGGAKVLRKGANIEPELRDGLYVDIEAEADRLYRLIEDLLVLARFEDQDTPSVANEPVLIQRILSAVIASEQPRWSEHEFVLSMPPGIPTVRGDPTYVEQVARNLLSNAAKYSQDGGSVEVIVEDAASEVVVRVLDRGPSFPAEDADRLFRLYYRSPWTVGVAAGAGIGLFVCRRLVEAMGGRIWARPRGGGGAEFGFAMPTLTEEGP